MRRSHLALLVGLQLAAARSRSFSIHDDLLAFPQFAVVFAPNRVSEEQAHALVERSNQEPTYSADFSHATANDRYATMDAAAAQASRSADSDEITGYAYEILNMSPHRYLCSIPMIQPPGPVNETENALAKAKEDREHYRAAVKGWELINDLEDSCLYYASGWWSYSFCKNREITQFHAISVSAHNQVPKRDPNGQEYVLGQVPSLPATAEDRQLNKRRNDDVDAAPPRAELQIKDDQPYLVQRLEGGTICDLTGKERTVEVQYQCVPGLDHDRIGWIKEVVTCSYIMMVDTPRLCSDVAFQPPVEKTANPIRCQLISDGGDAPQSLLDQHPSASYAQKEAESAGQFTDNSAWADKEDMDPDTQHVDAPQITVGGVLVGGKRVLSTGNEDGEPVKLQQLTNVFSPQPKVLKVVAQAASKADGGKTQELSTEELEKLQIDPKAVAEMREKLKKLAGDSGWKMEIFQMNEEDEKELLGYIDEPEAGIGGAGSKGRKAKQGKKAKQDTDDDGRDSSASGEGKDGKPEEGNKGGQEGSEEQFYHGDEL
ncbi:hypothetical protein E4U49_004404 [Claviceps purpurea]|nr:hypothetical protein E4U49_004404 [Claviceps purpurea]